MKVQLIFAVGGLLACGAQAQGGEPGGHPPRSPEAQAWCAAHARDCSDLRSLHLAARQACGNDQSTVGACKQAREQVQAKLKVMESAGFPPPWHGMGHDREGGGESP